MANLIKGRFVLNDTITADNLGPDLGLKGDPTASNPAIETDSTRLATTYFVQRLIDTTVLATEKGAANGVATLDSNSKIPNSQIPALAISDTFVVASQAEQVAVTGAEVGDIAIRTDIRKSYILRAEPASTFANWSELLSPLDAVTSVNGYVGIVVLGTGDVAESGNLYFTVSRARAAAILDTLAGSQTDQAASVRAVNEKFALYQKLVAGAKERFTLTSNQTIITLAHLAMPGTVRLQPDGGLHQIEGTDYNLSTVGGVTQITMLTALTTYLITGDIINVEYVYQT